MNICKKKPVLFPTILAERKLDNKQYSPPFIPVMKAEFKKLLKGDGLLGVGESYISGNSF